MYDPSDASPASGAPAASSDGRYVYLMSRLRSKQITMEEATELFAVQQSMIRQAARRSPPPPATSGAGASPTQAPVGGPGGLPLMSDEAFALALLAFGAGAGVLAAVLKRSQSSEAPRTGSR